MILRNFPLNGARPRNSKEMNDYVTALALKTEVDEVASKMASEDQDSSYDMDRSEGNVAMSNVSTYTDQLSSIHIRGTLSMDEEKKPEHMMVDIVPKRQSNRSYSLRREGDQVRYTRQYAGRDTVTHLVHDEATGTISMFERDELGRFPKKD